MAIIKCSDCGKEISDRAIACPHCGCPVDSKEITETVVSVPKKKKSKGWIFAVATILIVVAVAAVLVFVVGGSGVFDSMSEEYMIIDGETIALEDFAKDVEDNEIKFKTKYKGKKVTIVARVKEIDGGTYQTNLSHRFNAQVILNGGSFLNKFVVEAGSVSKASQFEVGDLVKVEGKLTTDLYGTSFYMYGPNTITKVSE